MTTSGTPCCVAYSTSPAVLMLDQAILTTVESPKLSHAQRGVPPVSKGWLSKHTTILGEGSSFTVFVSHSYISHCAASASAVGPVAEHSPLKQFLAGVDGVPELCETRNGLLAASFSRAI